MFTYDIKNITLRVMMTVIIVFMSAMMLDAQTVTVRQGHGNGVTIFDNIRDAVNALPNRRN